MFVLRPFHCLFHFVIITVQFEMRYFNFSGGSSLLKEKGLVSVVIHGVVLPSHACTLCAVLPELLFCQQDSLFL